MWVNPRFSESFEAIPFHYSFAECMHALAGVCGGVEAPGRGVMDTGIPATPARRGEHTGLMWLYSPGHTETQNSHVIRGVCDEPIHDEKISRRV